MLGMPLPSFLSDREVNEDEQVTFFGEGEEGKEEEETPGASMTNDRDGATGKALPEVTPSHRRLVHKVHILDTLIAAECSEP